MLLSQLLTKLVTGEAGVFMARLRRLMALYAVLAVFAIGLVGFLLGALYIWLADRYGNLATALGFAGGCLVLVIITWILIVLARRPPRKRADDRLQRDIASIASVAAVSNLPLIFRSVSRNKSLLLLPAVAVTGWGMWRALANYRNRTR